MAVNPREEFVSVPWTALSELLEAIDGVLRFGPDLHDQEQRRLVLAIEDLKFEMAK